MSILLNKPCHIPFIDRSLIKKSDRIRPICEIVLILVLRIILNILHCRHFTAIAMTILLTCIILCTEEPINRRESERGKVRCWISHLYRAAVCERFHNPLLGLLGGHIFIIDGTNTWRINRLVSAGTSFYICSAWNVPEHNLWNAGYQETREFQYPISHQRNQHRWADLQWIFIALPTSRRTCNMQWEWYD